VHPRATVTLPVEIQAHATGDDDQPPRQVIVVPSREPAEAGEVVESKAFQNMGIRIHRRVVIAVDGSGGAEDEIAVFDEESVPCEGRRGLVTSGQEIRQLRGERCRAAEPWGFDHSRDSRARVGRCLHAIGSLRLRGVDEERYN